MSSTRTLQQVVNWASTYVHLIPLTGQGGVVDEPALSIGNNVLQFILAPPFKWRWNRSKVTFTTTTGTATQDYSVSAPTFGWIERASISDGTTTWELEPRNTLPDAADTGRPLSISPEADDDEGNVTFRLYPLPDPSKTFTVTVTFQNKPVIFSALSGVWSPVPDEYAYIYNSGFLAGAFENTGDNRFAAEYQKFVESLIAGNEGLTDAEKSIFLTDKLFAIKQSQGAQMNVALGHQARMQR